MLTSVTRRVLVVAATGFGVLGLTGVADAATYTVNSTSDAALTSSGSTSCVTADGCTLRGAIQAADNTSGASQISLPAGTYTLTIASTAADDPSNGDLDVKNAASITLTGAGSGSTTINANDIDRAFAVQSGSGLSLSGLTIENGNPASASTGSQNGGAIYSAGALAITGDVHFDGNSSGADEGGAIYTATGGGSTVSITGATFSQNIADDEGGALYLDQPNTATITDSTFTGNQDDDEEGAGIYGNAGALTLSDSSFTNNNGEEGGAIYWDATTAVTISDSTFENNDGEEGGAVYDGDSTSMAFTGDTFQSNVAGQEEGGALYLDASPSTAYTLTDDEFTDNSAVDDGGAVYMDEGSVTASDSSFVDNGGGEEGGAIYADSGNPLSLTNVTITGNSAVNGGGIYFETSTQTALTNDTITGNSAAGGTGGGLGDSSDAVLGSGTGIRNTIVAENHGGDCDATLAASLDTGHNIDSDSSCFGGLSVAGDQAGVNPLVASPADNGGSVMTDALLTGSPAIDAGTSTDCPAADARGVARPQGSACDIGAFEAAAAGLTLTEAAPTTATAGNPYTYTFTVTGHGPAAATNATVSEQLPAGITLYGETASQGSCSSSGSPAKVTCNLGLLASGDSATVALVVTEANAGSLTSTGSATDDQGANVTASSTTTIGAAPVALSAPAAAAPRSTAISRLAAALKGEVTTNGLSTTYFFQYGKTKAYGLTTRIQTTTTSKAVSLNVSGLAAGTRYHYRLVAIDSGGVAYSADATFTTQAKASVKIALHEQSHKATRLPFAYTLSGQLGPLPKGVTKAQGCSGTVTVTITSGKRKFASQQVKLSRACTFKASFTLDARPHDSASGSLSATARFGGNARFKTVGSKRVGLSYS